MTSFLIHLKYIFYIRYTRLILFIHSFESPFSILYISSKKEPSKFCSALNSFSILCNCNLNCNRIPILLLKSSACLFLIAWFTSSIRNINIRATILNLLSLLRGIYLLIFIVTSNLILSRCICTLSR